MIRWLTVVRFFKKRRMPKNIYIYKKFQQVQESLQFYIIQHSCIFRSSDNIIYIQ